MTKVPGAMPITVPSNMSRKRMCEAPATMLMIANGATGTMRMATTANRPWSASRWLMAFTRAPPRRCTTSWPSKRPRPWLAAAPISAPSMQYTNPAQGPKATSVTSVKKVSGTARLTARPKPASAAAGPKAWPRRCKLAAAHGLARVDVGCGRSH